MKFVFKIEEKKRIVDDLEAIKKYFDLDIPDEKFEELIALDPTYKPGSNAAGTYGKWILNIFKKGRLKEEDFYRVPDLLKEFEKKKKYFANKDINQFYDLADFANKLDKVEIPELTQRQKENEARKTVKRADLNADVVYEDGDWIVYTPNDYLSSCKLSPNTRWCTGESSHGNSRYYDDYTKSAPLYIFHNKRNPNEKYQAHDPSTSFVNKNDQPVDIVDAFGNDENLLRFVSKALPRIYRRSAAFHKANEIGDQLVDDFLNKSYPIGYEPKTEIVTEIGDIKLYKPKDPLSAFYMYCDGNRGMMKRHFLQSRWNYETRQNEYVYSHSLEKMIEDIKNGEYEDANRIYSIENGNILPIDMEDFLHSKTGMQGNRSPDVQRLAKEKPDIYNFFIGGEGSPVYTKNGTIVDIKEGVRSIPKWFFSKKPDITEINIPASVTAIDKYAFNVLPNLRSINVDPENSKFFSEQGALGRKSTGEIIYEPMANRLARARSKSENLTEIKPGEYKALKPLKEFEIPSSVSKIGKDAFYGSGLKKITIPGTVKEIGAYAFGNCKSLKEAIIEEGVEKIDDYAFEGCSALSSIKIPDSVKYIGESIFQGCGSLRKIEGMNGVEVFKESRYHWIKSIVQQLYEEIPGISIETNNKILLKSIENDLQNYTKQKLEKAYREDEEDRKKSRERDGYDWPWTQPQTFKEFVYNKYPIASLKLNGGKSIIESLGLKDAALPAQKTNSVKIAEDEFLKEIWRISKNIANSIKTYYPEIEDVDEKLIAADIIRDLRLISGDIDPDDIPDDVVGNATKAMHKEYEEVQDFFDLLFGETSSKEQRLTRALASLKSPMFSPEAIDQVISSARFFEAAKRGQIPYVKAIEAKDSFANDVIEKGKDGYIIYSEKGKRLSKPYKTEKEAKERLKEIEMFKHMNKSDSVGKDAADLQEFANSLVLSQESLDRIEEVSERAQVDPAILRSEFAWEVAKRIMKGFEQEDAEDMTRQDLEEGKFKALEGNKAMFDSAETAKEWLSRFLVKEGDPSNKLGKTHIRPLKENERLPKGVKHKAMSETSGILEFKGETFHWHLDGDEIVVEKTIKDADKVHLWIVEYYNKNGVKFSGEFDSKEDAMEFIDENEGDENHNNMRIVEKDAQIGDSSIDKETLKRKIKKIFLKYAKEKGFDESDVEDFVGVHFVTGENPHIEIINDLGFSFYRSDDLVGELEKLVGMLEPYDSYTWLAYEAPRAFLEDDNAGKHKVKWISYTQYVGYFDDATELELDEENVEFFDTLEEAEKAANDDDYFGVAGHYVEVYLDGKFYRDYEAE